MNGRGACGQGAGGQGAGAVTIITPRLRLVEQGPGDVDDLHRLMSLWEVVRMTASWRHPVTREEVRARVAERSAGPGLFLSIRRRADAGSRYVGAAHILEGDIGYALLPEAWGQGVATEVAQALADHAFATTDWPELRAGVWADNPASVRVLEKVGFRETGRSSATCLARGEEVQSLDFTLPRPLAWP